jgi:hypothetical protein
MSIFGQAVRQWTLKSNTYRQENNNLLIIKEINSGMLLPTISYIQGNRGSNE